MISRRLLPCVFAVAIVACNSPTEPRQLRVITAANTVTIENPNDWPVFYLIANPRWLAVADLALCEDPASTCPRVPPHETIHVAYTGIADYEAGETEATLMQWRLVRQLDGTYRYRDLQTITLQLR